MALAGRDFLKELDFSRAELDELLDLAATLKRERREGRETPRLSGRAIALVFEKSSTRTRAAFEVAAFQQGAHTTYLDPTSSQIGHKESAADTARVLSGMFDAIEYRGTEQAIVEELAAFASVPVYNGLTNEWHPTQMLADFLTMREACGGDVRGDAWSKVSYCYLGDARYNMGNSLLVMGAIMGADVRICAPRDLWPDAAVQESARARAQESGARLLLTDDPGEALPGAAFVATDVWVSMGEPKEVWDERIALLTPYRVDAAAMARTGRDDAHLLHCLPAFHDVHTTVGREVMERHGMTDGLEVTHEVFESPASLVFQESENRLHTIKAVMVATLA